MNDLLSISSNMFVVAFFLYCAAFILFAVALMGRRWSNRDPVAHSKKWGKIAFIGSTLGLIFHLIFFVTRWIGGGHIPVSNMYEFMSFLSMMVMVAFTVVYLIYRKTLLGLFAVPISIIIMAYAAVFPQEVQPLIPSLQSYWLKIHVTLAAAGESFFAIGFAAGFMYLIRTVDFKSKEKRARRQQRWVEVVFFSVILVISFIATVFIFRASGYESVFTQTKVTGQPGAEQTVTQTVSYKLPPIVGPYQSKIVSYEPFLGMSKPLFNAPSWMNGVNAGRKFNTIIWSFITGIILYAILRLIARKPLGRAASPVMEGIDPDDLDEISYRAIAIGFPVFTLGALIFAMIWAEIAWGTFWSWDPKEVWALICWLFYSAYLHLRLSRGWQGGKSAWLSVIGFLVVMFTLVGVNLVIAGLHSYAGVD